MMMDNMTLYVVPVPSGMGSEELSHHFGQARAGSRPGCGNGRGLCMSEIAPRTDLSWARRSQNCPDCYRCLARELQLPAGAV